MRSFIEAFAFTEIIDDYFDDDDFLELQRELSSNPELGKVIPGCGGIRKVRFANPRQRKGKRGGIRIIYLDIPEAQVIHLITAYSKNEKADLTADEKKAFRHIADMLRAETKARKRKKRRNDG